MDCLRLTCTLWYAPWTNSSPRLASLRLWNHGLTSSDHPFVMTRHLEANCWPIQYWLHWRLDQNLRCGSLKRCCVTLSLSLIHGTLLCLCYPYYPSRSCLVNFDRHRLGSCSILGKRALDSWSRNVWRRSLFEGFTAFKFAVAIAHWGAVVAKGS